MARWLLDCRPLCGRPWRLGLATEPDERQAAFRLRYDVFYREMGFGDPRITAATDKDEDSFDSWCDHLILVDTEKNQVIGTYRAIAGADARHRGGLYGSTEFDFSPLDPILDVLLLGSRTCVHRKHRSGPAIQYLTFGMELLLRERGCRYFMGAESFRTDSHQELCEIASYVKKVGTDPRWLVLPMPASRVEGLQDVPTTEEVERKLPSIIRMELRMGFRAISPPAWDPDFRCYDILFLGQRDRLTPFYESFIGRIERHLPDSTRIAHEP